MGHHQQTLRRLRRSSARHLGSDRLYSVKICSWENQQTKWGIVNFYCHVWLPVLSIHYYPVLIRYLHYINVHCLFSTPSFHTHRLSHPGYQIHLFYISLTTFTILIHAFVGSWSLTINEPRQLSLLLDLDAAIGSRSESTAHGQVLHLNHWSVVTLWLCQNSYWKWLFIVDLPIENGGFP